MKSTAKTLALGAALLCLLAGGMALYYFKYVTQDADLFPYFTTAASFACREH